VSKIGQAIQQSQEGQPETMGPDPLYDERDWQEEQKADPGYDEFNQKLYEKRKAS
jgi:hypothetical protein